jgi:hypothetical protein
MTKELIDEEAREEANLYCYDIAQTIKRIATEHPKHFEVILALAGADVCKAVYSIYDNFIESDGKLPIMYGDMVHKSLGRRIIRMETEHNDKVADSMPLDEYKGLITNPNREA